MTHVCVSIQIQASLAPSTKSPPGGTPWFVHALIFAVPLAITLTFFNGTRFGYHPPLMAAGFLFFMGEGVLIAIEAKVFILNSRMSEFRETSITDMCEYLHIEHPYILTCVIMWNAFEHLLPRRIQCYESDSCVLSPRLSPSQHCTITCVKCAYMTVGRCRV